MENCVAAHRDCLRNPSPNGMLPEATGLVSGGPQDVSEPVGRRAERKKAAHALVHDLLAQCLPRRAIARHLGWGLNTVLRYANAARWQDTCRENRPRPSRLDPYKPYLELRFAAGGTSVTHLHSELVADNCWRPSRRSWTGNGDRKAGSAAMDRRRPAPLQGWCPDRIGSPG
ncbi:hypothetical protein [Streptomyces goshikiensis]|uniref:hypothetical protein n=1 Tax=Streptomyces goshikiensis TaxID=1942 RepID=UPI003657830A